MTQLYNLKSNITQNEIMNQKKNYSKNASSINPKPTKPPAVTQQ